MSNSKHDGKLFMEYDIYSALHEYDIDLVTEGFMDRLFNREIINKDLDTVMAETEKIDTMIDGIGQIVSDLPDDIKSDSNVDEVYHKLEGSWKKLESVLTSNNNSIVTFAKDTTLNLMQCVSFFASPLSTTRILKHGWAMVNAIVGKDLYTYVNLIELALLEYYTALRMNDIENMQSQQDAAMNDLRLTISDIDDLVLNSERKKGKTEIAKIADMLQKTKEKFRNMADKKVAMYDKRITEFANSIDTNIRDKGSSAFDDQINKEKEIITKLGNLASNSDNGQMTTFAELTTESCEIAAAKYRQKLALAFREMIFIIRTDTTYKKSINDKVDDINDAANKDVNKIAQTLKESKNDRINKGRQYLSEHKHIDVSDLFSADIDVMINVMTYVNDNPNDSYEGIDGTTKFNDHANPFYYFTCYDMLIGFAHSIFSACIFPHAGGEEYCIRNIDYDRYHMHTGGEQSIKILDSRWQKVKGWSNGFFVPTEEKPELDANGKIKKDKKGNDPIEVAKKESEAKGYKKLLDNVGFSFGSKLHFHTKAIEDEASYCAERVTAPTAGNKYYFKSTSFIKYFKKFATSVWCIARACEDKSERFDSDKFDPDAINELFGYLTETDAFPFDNRFDFQVACTTNIRGNKEKMDFDTYQKSIASLLPVAFIDRLESTVKKLKRD